MSYTIRTDYAQTEYFEFKHTRTKHTPRCHKESTNKTHENLAQGSRHNHRRCQGHRHRHRTKEDESPKETRAIVSDVTRDTTRATHLRFRATQYHRRRRRAEAQPRERR